MKLTCIAGALMAAAFAHAEENVLTAKEKADGWVLLFDGKTMNGWADPRQKTPPGDAWTVEDGSLKTLPNPQITEELFTTQTFRDFELSFQWRISAGGNSGLKYRIQDRLLLHPVQPGERFEASVERSYKNPVTQRAGKVQEYVVGFEYQITDDALNRDAAGNQKHTAGALYDMVAPSQHVAKPVGEWNQARIVVRGSHTEHWLNGVKVVDSDLKSPAALEGVTKRWADAPHVYELMTKQPKRDCPISLQNHGDDAWFRNIKIRKL